MLESRFIKPDGTVDVWDLGPARGPERTEWLREHHGPTLLIMAPVEANHAMTVDPDRYKTELPRPERKPEPVEEPKTKKK